MLKKLGILGTKLVTVDLNAHWQPDQTIQTALLAGHIDSVGIVTKILACGLSVFPALPRGW